MPVEHQRVFLIEEKVRQTPEDPVGPRKGLARANAPEPRGFFVVERNPIRPRAPPALANGTFFVPFAHVDRLVRR